MKGNFECSDITTTNEGKITEYENVENKISEKFFTVLLDSRIQNVE